MRPDLNRLDIGWNQTVVTFIQYFFKGSDYAFVRRGLPFFYAIIPVFESLSDPRGKVYQQGILPLILSAAATQADRCMHTVRNADYHCATKLSIRCGY